MTTTESNTTNSYPQPSPEFIDDIRKRMAELPKEVLERADYAFMHDPIQTPGSILYRAGLCLSSHELYEYRKTLFPPNSLVDPDTQGRPILRNPEVGRGACRAVTSERRQVPAEPLTDRSADSLSASATENGTSRQSETKAELLTTGASHSTHLPDVTHVTDSTHAPQPSNHPLIPSSTPSVGASLLSDLRSVLSRYVVLPEMAAEALALWVVHTYAFTLRQVTTYIGVVSPEKRCGKTTLLELLGLLANRSLTAANISPSALFRVIEETQPTLLIDEADTFLQGRDELAGILNAGYRKGNSYVVRIAQNKPNGRTSYTSPQSNTQPEFAQWSNERVDGSPSATEFAKYSCWCPKVMAAIGRLPDTLADRCIIITMQRKMPGEKCERIRDLNASAFRKRCAQFVREHSGKITDAQPQIPSTLNDRAADIWEPLFALADLAGGEWPELARQAAQKLSACDDDLTLVGYFLKDLRNLMIIKNVDRMLSRDIVSALNPLHDRPWEDLRRGREINEWWLGWQLRQLGIRTKSFRVAEAVARGYTLSDIEGAFRRYVPNAEAHLTQPALAEQLSGTLNPTKTDEARVEAQLDRFMKQLLATLPNADP